MFMALVTSLVVLFYCCVTADILTKLLQQCFLIFIVVPWLYLGNSQVSVYRTIGPSLVYKIICCGYVLKSHRQGDTNTHPKPYDDYVLWMCIRIAEVKQIQPYDFMETL